MSDIKNCSFIKGEHDQLIKLLDILSEFGYSINKNSNISGNHIWYYKSENSWSLRDDLHFMCEHEITTDSLYNLIAPKNWYIKKEDVTREFIEWFCLKSKFDRIIFNNKNHVGYGSYNGRFGSFSEETNHLASPISIKKWKALNVNNLNVIH
jgi:hypothetical protein